MYLNSNFSCIVVDIIIINIFHIMSCISFGINHMRAYGQVWGRMSQFSHFQVAADEISSNGQYPVRCTTNLSPVQRRIVSCCRILLGTGKTQFDYEPNHVSHQNPQVVTRGQYEICHTPPTCNLLPFLGYKTPVLWLVSSLRADID